MRTQRRDKCDTAGRRKSDPELPRGDQATHIAGIRPRQRSEACYPKRKTRLDFPSPHRHPWKLGILQGVVRGWGVAQQPFPSLQLFARWRQDPPPPEGSLRKTPLLRYFFAGIAPPPLPLGSHVTRVPLMNAGGLRQGVPSLKRPSLAVQEVAHTK